MKRVILALAAALITPLLLMQVAGQQSKPQQPAVEEDAGAPIKVDVDVVSLYCSVRNKQNGLVSTADGEVWSTSDGGQSWRLK